MLFWQPPVPSDDKARSMMMAYAHTQKQTCTDYIYNVSRQHFEHELLKLFEVVPCSSIVYIHAYILYIISKGSVILEVFLQESTVPAHPRYTELSFQYPE